MAFNWNGISWSHRGWFEGNGPCEPTQSTLSGRSGTGTDLEVDLGGVLAKDSEVRRLHVGKQRHFF
jgi:hypothetical protein